MTVVRIYRKSMREKGIPDEYKLKGQDCEQSGNQQLNNMQRQQMLGKGR